MFAALLVFKTSLQNFLFAKKKIKKKITQMLSYRQLQCSAVGISAIELFEALCVLECFYGLLDMSHCGAFTLKCN